MCEPRVSVIIPAYKCAGMIGRAIDSLLAQTRQPDEIIVVDDGSPDDIPEALRPYGDRITYLRKSNGGAASARNAGLDIATGDLIAFLDSDDLWDAAKLKDQLDIFARYPEVGFITSRYRIDSIDGNIDAFPDLDGIPWDSVQNPKGARAFDLAMLAWTSVVVFRRSILGSNRFDVTLKIAEDRDLWVRLVTKTPIYLQSAVTGTLMELKGSLSRENLDLDCRCMLQMLSQHASLLGKDGVRRWKTRVYRRWAGTYLGQGMSNLAIKPALKRLFYQPLSAEGWWALAKSSYHALGNSRLSNGASRERVAG